MYRHSGRYRPIGPLVPIRPHFTTPTLTLTPTPTRPTRLHPYVRHARFPREDVGVGVTECGQYAAATVNSSHSTK